MTEGECFFILSFRRTLCATFPTGEGFSPNRCLQNNDCFVPKPLRFKCLRILPLFCVICARLVKGRWLFALQLVVIFAKDA